MWDVSIAEIAGRQYNRVSRQQLLALGMSERAIHHRVVEGRLVPVAEGVFAVAPLLDDKWGRWMGATLTAPHTFLYRETAACAWGALSLEPRGTTVVRPGSGGPRRMSGVTVHRSSTLEHETAKHRGVPITTPPRTLLDLACCASSRALKKALREFARLEHVTIYSLGDFLATVAHRRGALRLGKAMADYRGLPIARARSGAEVRAMELLRDAGVELPRLNVIIAGEEADLSWARHRLIIEVDGGPFHQDKGEDARKEAAWKAAGWRVLRVDSDEVYDRPTFFLEQAPKTQNVQRRAL